MTASPAPAPSADTNEIILTILSGPESGVGYKLLGQSVTLGRSADNDVVLKDTKSSRHHARIELTNGEYWIRDLGSQNGIIINGTATKQGLLHLGDQFMIGSTLMRFGSTGLSSHELAPVSAAPPIPRARSSAPDSPIGPNPTKGWLPPLKDRSRNRKSNDTSLFPVVLFAVGVIAIFIFIQNPKGLKKAFDIKDDSALETEIDDISKTNEQRQEEILKKGKDTQQYAEAQAFYLRGFREFSGGNYSRAIENFEASLALFPQHPLAKRYLERSHLKLNELVSEALQRGEKDFELQRYTEAFSEYRTVVLLTADPRNKMYQLALKRIEAINLILVNSR